jgi:myo-inositol-1(or 4)-monophosphatase
MEPIASLLQTAERAAREAGQLLRARLSDERDVQKKGLRDIVTDADLAAERVVVQIIRARFPEHALLAEEGGRSENESPYVWVVDPLDGTTNYSRRFPVFSVSVGAVHQGRLTVGVVYDPLHDHLFAAQRGGGATLNGKPLQVSQFDRVSDAVVGLDWAHAQRDRYEVVARLDRLAPACRTLRGIGSAALALCYVAAGWLDAYFHVGLKPWDMAAGLLLIEEAGGRVTEIDGQGWRPWAPRVLVSNGHLHPQLLALMDGVSDEKRGRGEQG